MGATSVTPRELSNIYRAKAYRGTSNQAIATGDYRLVQLNAELYDSNNNFDSTTNYCYTCPVTGYYQINAMVGFSNNATGSRVMGVYTGTTWLFKNWGAPYGNVYFSVGGSSYEYLTAGTTLYLYAYQNSGGNLDVLYSRENTYLDIHLLSI